MAGNIAGDRNASEAPNEKVEAAAGAENRDPEEDGEEEEENNEPVTGACAAS